MNKTEDTSLWRRGSGYKDNFSTYETWCLIRETKSEQSWACGVWFSNATPKFAFIIWLAMLNRMSTLDRVAQWSQGVDTTCLLCKNDVETRNHLFFACSYSSQVWEHLTKGMMGEDYTNDWSEIVQMISEVSMDRKRLFCLRYSFQVTLYMIWRERNKLKHGDKKTSHCCIEEDD